MLLVPSFFSGKIIFFASDKFPFTSIRPSNERKEFFVPPRVRRDATSGCGDDESVLSELEIMKIPCLELNKEAMR